MPNFKFLRHFSNSKGRTRLWREISKIFPGTGIIYLAILLSFSLLPPIVLAAGIQVSPPSLEISARGGKQATAKLVVANPTADVQIFTVSADDFQDAISAMPESFTLDAGGRREISLTVNFDKLSRGDAALATNISVVGKPLADSRIRVGTGVKIPITIVTAHPQGSRLMRAVIPAAIFTAAGVLMFWLLKKRGKKIDSTFK